MHLIAVALLLFSPLAPQTVEHAERVARAAADHAHAQRVAERRDRAKARVQQDRTRFSPAEFGDIEARYRSAYDVALGGFMILRQPEGAEILAELIRVYPTSNRAGCATLRLARQRPSPERERQLRLAISRYSDAWCDSGVQVGALARALLAVYYAGLGRFDEAEQFAAELAKNYPRSIDESGAPLDDVLEGVRLLRVRK